MSVRVALERVNAEPRLSWMSATSRALLAVALYDGDPLRVVSNVDDAIVLLRAEHLMRLEQLELRAALHRARAEDTDEATLRGIVRFAAALSADSDELDALLMEHGVRGVKTLTREQVARLGLELFARPEAPRGITFEQLVAAFPQDDVAPVELDGELVDGVPVGRCSHCAGPVFAGAATISIGWPVTSPEWETITPDVARLGSLPAKMSTCAQALAAGGDDVENLRAEYAALSRKYEAAKTKKPAANTKLHPLLAGELQVLCTVCTMNVRHGGLSVEDPFAPEEIVERTPVDVPMLVSVEKLLDIAARAAVTAAPTILEVVQGAQTAPETRGARETACGPPGNGDVMGGLLDREKAIATAVAGIKVDARRLEAVRGSISLAGDDVELRYRILAWAWQAGRPLRIVTVPGDAARLDELTDLALRGGSVERAIERVA